LKKIAPQTSEIVYSACYPWNSARRESGGSRKEEQIFSLPVSISCQIWISDWAL